MKTDLLPDEIVMPCTPEQYEKYLKRSLLKMGYHEDDLWMDAVDVRTGISVSVEEGMWFFDIDDDDNKENGVYKTNSVVLISMEEFNPRLFLALAARTKEGCFGWGEWFKHYIDNSWLIHREPFPGKAAICQESETNYLINLPELHLVKPTTAEIIEKFKDASYSQKEEVTKRSSFAKMLLDELNKNIITHNSFPKNMYFLGYGGSICCGTWLEKGIGKSLPQPPADVMSGQGVGRVSFGKSLPQPPTKTRTKTYVPGYGEIEFPEKGDKYEYYTYTKDRRTLTVDYAETIWKPEVQVMVHFTRDDVDNPGTREYNDFMQAYSRIREKPVVKHDLKEDDIYKRKGHRGRQEFIIERFTNAKVKTKK